MQEVSLRLRGRNAVCAAQLCRDAPRCRRRLEPVSFAGKRVAGQIHPFRGLAGKYPIAIRLIPLNKQLRERRHPLPIRLDRFRVGEGGRVAQVPQELLRKTQQGSLRYEIGADLSEKGPLEALVLQHAPEHVPSCVDGGHHNGASMRKVLTSGQQRVADRLKSLRCVTSTLQHLKKIAHPGLKRLPRLCRHHQHPTGR